MEYENFNAATAKLRIRGLSTHPGTAKGRMKMRPCWPWSSSRCCRCLKTRCIQRDTRGLRIWSACRARWKRRRRSTSCAITIWRCCSKKKARMHKIAQYLNERYGEGTVELSIVAAYFNMKEQIEPHFHLIENAKRAMREIAWCARDPHPWRHGRCAAVVRWACRVPQPVHGRAELHSRPWSSSRCRPWSRWWRCCASCSCMRSRERMPLSMQRKVKAYAGRFERAGEMRNAAVRPWSCIYTLRTNDQAFCRARGLKMPSLQAKIRMKIKR